MYLGHFSKTGATHSEVEASNVGMVKAGGTPKIDPIAQPAAKAIAAT